MPDAFALANAFVRIRPDTTGFRPEADAKLKAAMAGLDPKVQVSAGTDLAKKSIADLRVYLDTLVRRNYQLRLGLNDKDLQAQLTKDYVLLSRLSRRVDMNLNLANISRVQAQLLAVDASMDRTKARIDGLGKTVTRFGGIWGILTNRTKIPLFGGQSFAWIPRIFVGIGALHLLVDVVAEMLAVLIPAGLALGAFALAAADSFRQVFHQLQNMHTVMDATGQTMKPFTSNLEKMHQAVRPAVFALLGDALTVVNAKTGEFNKLALGTASVMQEFGARIAVAIKSAGISEFLKNAVTDLHGVMDIFGNLFGVLGNFLHVMPGIAQGLLAITDAFTHFLEVATSGPIVGFLAKIALGFHGVLVYGGLLGALLGKLIAPALAGIGGMAIKAAEGVAKFGKVGLYASSALGVFGNTARVASKLPWGWIAAAAIAVGFLAFKMFTARDATQKWIDSLNSLMRQQNAVIGFITLQEQQVLVAHRLISVNEQLAQTWHKGNDAIRTVIRGNTQMFDSQTRLKQSQSELTAEQKNQAEQFGLYIDRLGALGKAFGGVGEAQGFLIASGVTMDDMLKAGQHGWELLFQRVTATMQGYKLMGQTGGVLGADMNAMNLVINDQYTAMQKLNQTWDTLMGVISGGQTNFITFEQDILSTNKAFAGTGGTVRNVTATFASAATQAKNTGVSMNGMNAASLQLRQTWQTAFSGAQSLIDALRNMSAMKAGGFPQVTLAMKDMLRQLVVVGSTGKASRDELVALAGELNPTIHNFKELTKWLGSTKGAGKDLNKLVAQMGGSLKDLAKDASDLSGTLRADLIQQFNVAKISASGAGNAIKVLAGDIVNGASAGKKYHDETKLYQDFRNAGLSAREAQRLIEAMTGAIFKIPTSRHISITESGSGHFTISGPGAKAFARGHGVSTSEVQTGVAAGGFIPGSGNRDTFPAMLTPGEVVIPKWMVKAGMVDHLRGRLPGFASGGQVPGGKAWPWPHTGLGPVQLGVATLNWDKQLNRAFTSAMQSSMASAMRAAIDRAKAQAAAAFGDTGARSGSAAVAQSFARSVLPRGWSWPALLSLWNQESGWSAYAVNRSSGAYGIPQSLGHGHPYNLGDYKAQIMWGINYIAGRYGNSQAAWAHEVAFNWYNKGGRVKSFDKGGWLMPGMTMAVNRTGHPERVSAHREPIVIRFQSSGAHDFDRFMMNWIQRTVRHQGGGDVQLTFGTG